MKWNLKENWIRADVERNKRTVNTEETFQNKRKTEERRDEERKVLQEGHLC